MFLTPDPDREVLFNHVTTAGIIPALLHQDGATSQVEMILTPSEVEAHHAKLGMLIDERRRHLADVEAERERLDRRP